MSIYCSRMSKWVLPTPHAPPDPSTAPSITLGVRSGQETEDKKNKTRLRVPYTLRVDASQPIQGTP